MVQPPEHGTLTRLDERTFRFTSSPGKTGKITFPWQLHDERDKSPSSTATIQVKPDTEPPIVEGVRSTTPDHHRFRIDLNEPVTKESATNPKHLSIDPDVPIKEIKLQRNGRTIRVHTVKPLKTDKTFRITIRNLVDRSVAENTMPGPVTLSFSRRPYPTEKLLLLARGNGDARDRSGNNHHGSTTQGAFFSSDQGKAGGFGFSGRNGNKKNSVNVGPIKPFQEAKTFTVAFWFRRTRDLDGDSNHDTSNILFSQGSDGSNDNLEIGTEGNTVEVYLHTKKGNGTKRWNGTIRNHHWYHLALTFNSERTNETHLLINGRPVKKWSTWSGKLAPARSPVTIGNTHHVETPFSGVVDDVFVYNRALQPEEIRTIQGSPPYVRGKDPYPLNDLLLLASGDGNAKDQSGFRRHGTPSKGVSVKKHLGKQGAFQFSGNRGKGQNFVRFEPLSGMKRRSSWTISFWFRRSRKRSTNAENGTSTTMFRYGQKDPQLVIGTNGTEIDVSFRNKSELRTRSWEGHLDGGRWYHLTLTYDRKRPNNLWLFINGRSVSKWPLHENIHLTDAPVILGNTPDGSSPFAGIIDEFLMYGRASGPDDVETLRGKKPFPKNNLLLLARGDGNARDQSGNNHHGTLSDGAKTVESKGFRGCFSFAGASGNRNNAVNFGQLEELQHAESFTVAFWFRRTSDTNGNSNHGTSNILFSQGSDSANDNLEIGTEGSKVEIYLDTEGTDTMEAREADLQDHKWYHLTLTFKGDRKKEAWLYLNGQPVKKWGVWDNRLDKANSPVTIGNTLHRETPFTGMIDEIFVYGRALNQQQLHTIIETGSK